MNVFKTLNKYKYQLTKQQYLTLKGQAKAGDENAAIKGLNTLLNRKK